MTEQPCRNHEDEVVREVSWDLAKRTVHILPVDDVREHQETALCWCRPITERVGTGTMIVHEAFEARGPADAD